MTDKKLSVIDGNREALEKEKADEIVKALLVDKDRDAALEIAEKLKPRGVSALTVVKQGKASEK